MEIGQSVFKFKIEKKKKEKKEKMKRKKNMLYFNFQKGNIES